MRSMCKHGGKERVKYWERPLKISTLFTETCIKTLYIPQKYALLHNFYTHESTSSRSNLTDKNTPLSTVSTDTITTTTIKYKERS